MAQYDAAVLELYADKMYRQARMLAISYFVRYGFVTFLIVFVGMFYALHPSGPKKSNELQAAFTFAAFVAFLIGGVGAAVGWEKAFQLRVEAQKILCQVEIERNTRSGEPGNDIRAGGGQRLSASV